jgi:hypothetical protein
MIKAEKCNTALIYKEQNKIFFINFLKTSEMPLMPFAPGVAFPELKQIQKSPSYRIPAVKIMQ